MTQVKINVAEMKNEKKVYSLLILTTIFGFKFDKG